MALHSLPLFRGNRAMLLPRGKVGRFFFLYSFVFTSSLLCPLVQLPALCYVWQSFDSGIPSPSQLVRAWQFKPWSSSLFSIQESHDKKASGQLQLVLVKYTGNLVTMPSPILVPMLQRQVLLIELIDFSFEEIDLNWIFLRNEFTYCGRGIPISRLEVFSLWVTIA